MKRFLPFVSVILMMVGMPNRVDAQSELYPRHFNLHQVELLDGPMKVAMYKNIEELLQYDTDRLLTPFVRQAGLASTTDSKSPYHQWLTKHPNFRNWGGDSFDLSGHVGGHYLSALALAYAACHDVQLRQQLKTRLDYMLQVLKDCQDQYDQNTEGLYGYIGGQPIMQSWKDLFSGNTATIRGNWGWVPFYVQHKVLAGLRDAYLYGGSDVAKELFRKLADWSVNLVSRVSDSDFQGFLDCEHGGMNESMLDAYQLFGEQKYLNAARKYTHRTMLNGMQTLNTTFLDGRHANTQVPKYIGMERIGEADMAASGSKQSTYLKAARNFWQDVAQNRTVCIGGNSVNEHFLSVANSNRYIDQLDGPESCNSNNMLKLSEMLADQCVADDPQAAARYVDFYEQTMWNHILSTQDPTTGGYVYFTTLRPQGYRIYSQVNQGMWCCVGTGMENHSKYGHFIYTHDGDKMLYVNLFTPSRLVSDDFCVTQQTLFPAINPVASNIPNSNTVTTEITVEKAGTYAIAVRHPSWAGSDYAVMVNGAAVNQAVTKGEASYVSISRTWKAGDRIVVWLPMELRYEECPNYTDYIAFKFGPILLGAATTALAEGDVSGLPFEQLRNEYGGEGRMDHAPGSRASSKNLNSAPLLIGERADVLSRIERQVGTDLRFTIDVSRPGVASYSWKQLTLQPFYQIHHQRYMCYWYQQTEEAYRNSTMAQTEAELEALQERTLDFVAPGEQQSEAGHESSHSADSSTGEYNTEHYRDARAGGFIQYTLFNNSGIEENLSIMFRFTVADKGRSAVLTVDGQNLADITIPATVKKADGNGFYNVEYPIPADLARGKKQFVVRLTASASTLCPGLYYVRLLKDYNNHAYHFRATDWTTGDPNRVSAQRITYDEQQNIIHVQASGQNNVCLMMQHENCNYTIDRQQQFLVVRGTNLRTGSTDSYLWWLNGTNHGSQVAPVQTRTLTVGGKQQQLVVWNMTTCGLYENFQEQRPNICMGPTIFGLTSSTGRSDIYDINFVASVDDYADMATAVDKITSQPSAYAGKRFDLGGRRAAVSPLRGIVVEQGRGVALH